MDVALEKLRLSGVPKVQSAVIAAPNLSGKRTEWGGGKDIPASFVLSFPGQPLCGCSFVLFGKGENYHGIS